MTFEQLEIFISAASQPTFFDAAEALHMTQPTLSKQVMRLEQELEVKLFDRSRRSATLTEAGKCFLPEARKLLKQYRQSLQVLEPFLPDHTLRIGTLPILTQYHLTEAFRDFSREHPDIQVILEEVEEAALADGFARGYYDMIIAREQMAEADFPFETKACVLAQDELTAVLPASHPLSEQPKVALSQLAEGPFILMNPYTSVHQLCICLFRENGLSPRILRTARAESIISAVEIGEGISLLPKSNLKVFRQLSSVAVPLNPPVYLPVMLISKKGKNGNAARTFWEVFFRSRRV